MKLVKRYDYESSVVTAKTERTAEGFLKVMARATRIGVLKYKQMDGTVVRELRHPDEVFKSESMATLALKPYTNNHPSTLLDTESASMHVVGTTGETVKIDEGKYLEVMCVLFDKDAIADAEKGKIEVSPGYACELDFTPGVFDGEEYDAIQKNIRYNHLAQVKKGRSGPEVRLRMDADDAVLEGLNFENTNKEGAKTVKIKLDGKEFEVADELGKSMEAEMKNKARPVAEEMDAMKKDADAKKKKIEELEEEKKDAEKKKDKAEAKADGLEAEMQKLKSQRQDTGAVDQKAVKARVSLEKVAQAAGVEKFDAMDDLDLKKAVILVDSPEFKFDGKSEDYINARFDVAAEAINASDASARKLGEKITGGARTAEVMDADDARQKMIARNQAQWKGKAE